MRRQLEYVFRRVYRGIAPANFVESTRARTDVQVAEGMLPVADRHTEAVRASTSQDTCRSARGKHRKRPRTNYRRLTLEPIEPRMLLAADILDPGEILCDDEMTNVWDPGAEMWMPVITPATVCVHNNGWGTIYATAGGGVGTATPVAGTHFAVFVEGMNGYAGDGYWSGDAEVLSFMANGIVGPITISGDLYVTAEQDIGPLDAGNINWVWSMTGSAATLTASGNIVEVFASAGIGDVEAGGYVQQLASGGGVGNIEAGGDIGWVTVGAGTGDIVAGGSIGKVEAGTSIGGTVSAGADIGFELVVGYYSQEDGGIFAGENVSDDVTAAGEIEEVEAGIDVVGDVSAVGRVIYVQAGNNISGDITAGEAVYQVSTYLGDISSSITAGTSVGWMPPCDFTTDPSCTFYPNKPYEWGGGGVSSGRNFVGSVSAGTYVLGVNASNNLTARVNASTYINAVNAGNDMLATVNAGTYVNSVYAGNDGTQNVSAGGNVGSVRAGHDQLAAVTAGGDVGYVSAGNDQEASVHAGGCRVWDYLSLNVPFKPSGE